MLDAINY